MGSSADQWLECLVFRQRSKQGSCFNFPGEFRGRLGRIQVSYPRPRGGIWALTTVCLAQILYREGSKNTQRRNQGGIVTSQVPEAPELSAFMISAQPRAFPISQDHHQRLTHVAFAHPLQAGPQCDSLHETHVVTTRLCENKQSKCWQSHFQTTGNGFQAEFTATVQHLGNKPQMRKTN